MTTEAVELEERGGIAVITLNRPHNRNSMTPELLESFAKATEAVRISRELRVVVIAGSGTCFSAGADFRSQVQLDDESLLEHERSFAIYKPFLSVLDIEIPVIAALTGHAVGGGFGLALLCDIRIANRTSKYGANFTKLGIAPGMSVSYLLPRLIGLSRASDMLYSGRLVLGEEAEKMGLVSSAHDSSEQVLEAAMEMARDIAASAPVAVRLTKRALLEQLGWNPKLAARRESFAQAATLNMDDAKEGMAALLEKRKPVFHGR